ncbi:hypothetical protein DYI37_04005 [Fulvimarina endophytica]|uniref:Uncharacterized protein n=1 Tax=Fulvimarina endophytica TaxID=2293836 RepID=A0A371X739_9HYPH|nr:hypothetical protein [Fulvimarina endophytica]RFC65038.1 hypothetical protein DYI37_04005 [Fulvimarina endophytica]
MAHQQTIMIPQTEADLLNLIAKRVTEAMTSVIQLAETPEQAFVFASMGHTSALGCLAGAYANFAGLDLNEVDPVDVAETILRLGRETKARSAPSAETSDGR